ncbi:pseudouridine synthase [Paenalcaligenes niemegkensis]|uniref:pseudouridine synthase n=1 Tax=Paenalcaligenes niemegkensis TaxID=2895469 RepID=UPI001EE78CFB|nr:pseudouridine synthase [Paenalcaligenes niemegkensis]MCQ9617637.1 pseudouridine synthase [Paenalcaligenes niemegkensis]
MSQNQQKKSKIVPPLPVREGIAPSRVWLPRGQWQTLGEFLFERFVHLDPSGLESRISRGDIVNGSGEAQAMTTPYQPDQWLWYYREVENEAIVPFELSILHADQHLIAVDKPHFLASVPTGSYLRETALTRVRLAFDNSDITPLHRLDRDTAGVLLFCVKPEYRGAYQRLFQTQKVGKVYEAVAPTYTGQSLPFNRRSCIELTAGEFVVREVEGVPNSETVVETLATWFDSEQRQSLTHYQLRPITGRKHQLRVHMSGLGCPILNDSYYPVWDKNRAIDDYRRPLQLLARRVAFVDPIDGQYREYCSQRQLASVLPGGVE